MTKKLTMCFAGALALMFVAHADDETTWTDGSTTRTVRTWQGTDNDALTDSSKWNGSGDILSTDYLLLNNNTTATVSDGQSLAATRFYIGYGWRYNSDSGSWQNSVNYDDGAYVTMTGGSISVDALRVGAGYADYHDSVLSVGGTAEVTTSSFLMGDCASKQGEGEDHNKVSRLVLSGTSTTTINGEFKIGSYSGSSNRVEISETATLALNGETRVGNAGSTVFEMTGGTVTSANRLYIGRGGANTTATMSGGTIDATANGFSVGTGSGTTVFTMTGGTINGNDETLIGVDSSEANAIFNLNGGTLNGKTLHIGRNAGTATFNLYSDLTIGNNAWYGTLNLGYWDSQYSKGYLNIYEDATLTVTNGSPIVGRDKTCYGELHNYGTFTVQNGSIIVGNNGDGKMVVHSGTVSTTTGDIYIGNGSETNSTGEVILDGGTLSGKYMGVGQVAGDTGYVTLNSGSTLTLTGGLNIGNYGTGTLTLNGGSLSFSGTPNIGNTASATGYVHVVSGTFQSGGNDIYVGKSGMGVMTIDGGTVSCQHWLDMNRDATAVEGTTINLNGGVLNVGLVNNAGSNQATFNWNGGTFKPTGNYEYIFRSETSGMIDVNVLAGGAILDTDGHNVSIQPVLSGVGNFVKRGEGICWIKQAASLGRGIVVEAGALVFEAGVTSGAAAATPMKEISVAEDATLDLHNSEVYVQSYKLAGVAQAAGIYTDHNGTIHVSAAGAPVTATWTNATGDGDFANPANWTCYDANGVAIWDALPTAADTVVTIPYDGDFFDTTGISAKEIVWAFPASTDENINLRPSGYSFGETISLDGGTTKFYNALNGVMMAADAWYDPSDGTAVSTNEEGKVTSLANKAHRGAEMDAAAIDSENMPTVADGFVVFDGDYGFKSAGTIESSETLPYTLFTVSNRNRAYGDGNSLYTLEISSGDGMYEGALHILQWQINQWDYRLRAYVYTDEGTRNWTGNPTDLGSGNYVDKNHVFDVSLDGNTLTAGKIVHNGNGFDTAVKSLDFYGRTAASGGKLHVAYGSNFTDHRNVKSYGKVGESLVFSSAITEAERTNIRNYLACKWCDEPWTTEPTLGTNTLSSLALSNGAVADFDGATAEIGDIAGAGTISNGNVTVTGTITVTVNDDGTIDLLVIDGSLTLGEGAKLVVKNAKKLSAGTALDAITATGGISGAFASVETEPEGVPLRAKVDANVLTIMRRTGLVIIFK